MVSKHLKTDKYDKTVRLCRNCHDLIEELIHELKVCMSIQVGCEWARRDQALAQFWLFKFGERDVIKRFRTHYYHCEKTLKDEDTRKLTRQFIINSKTLIST